MRGTVGGVEGTDGTGGGVTGGMWRISSTIQCLRFDMTTYEHGGNEVA